MYIPDHLELTSAPDAHQKKRLGCCIICVAAAHSGMPCGGIIVWPKGPGEAGGGAPPPASCAISMLDSCPPWASRANCCGEMLYTLGTIQGQPGSALLGEWYGWSGWSRRTVHRLSWAGWRVSRWAAGGRAGRGGGGGRGGGKRGKRGTGQGERGKGWRGEGEKAGGGTERGEAEKGIRGDGGKGGG